ncbi:hypothetical protein DFJ74DRAFT_755707 [Hyaloraphidium curvatum]|nr:hypothetical protein DFJ74DRAFT_755707 [Hyaloraphidium curvatum]
MLRLRAVTTAALLVLAMFIWLAPEPPPRPGSAGAAGGGLCAAARFGACNPHLALPGEPPDAALAAECAALHGPPKSRLVVGLPSGGLADSWRGYAAAFYVALLTGARLRLGTFASASLAWAYHSKVPGVFSDGDPADFYAELARIAAANDSVRFDSSSPAPTVPDYAGDLLAAFTGHSTVLLKTNKGAANALWRNPRYRRVLERLGLTRESMFACAHDRLVGAPRPEALAPHAAELAVLTDPNVFTIGVHIRLHDRGFVGGEPDLPRSGDNLTGHHITGPYLRCASELASSLGRPPDTVRTYLASSSVALRRLVAEQLAPRILVSTSVPVQHTNPGFRFASRRNLTAPLSQEGVRAAAAEMHLLSLCDALVIGERGFGRMAAAMQIAPGGKVRPAFFAEGEGTRCRIGDAAGYDEVAAGNYGL